MVYKMEKERVYWIDQAKALGLIVVMLVHGPIPLLLEHYLRSFSMPRFFIISGLFLNLEKPFKEFVQSKVVRLLIPYFLFSFGTFLVWLLYRTISTEPDALVNPLNAFAWIFYGNGGGNMVHNRPLWFLPSLFTTLLLVYFMIRVPKPYVYGVIVLSTVFGYFLLDWEPIRPPWSLDLMFTTAALVAIGYLYRNNFLFSKPLSWTGLFIWTLVSVTTAFSNVFLRLSGADVGNYFLFYISAIAGTIVTLDLTKRMPYNHFLSFVGRHSLPIYAMHITVYLFLAEGFKQVPSLIKLYHLEAFINLNSPVYGLFKILLYLVLGFGVPLLLMKLYDWSLLQLTLKYEKTSLPYEMMFSIKEEEQPKPILSTGKPS